MPALPLRDRLIVGLDLSDRSEAEKIVAQLGDAVSFYKIGYQLALAGGLQFITDLRLMGKRVFLDMKLLDIGHTVTRAVENILRLDVSMLTIHAYPQAMRAAAQVAKGSDLTLLAVTVLTSMDEVDLRAAGYQKITPEQLVTLRAIQAMEAGFGGLVASAQEAKKLRGLIGADKALVTPGIRLTSADDDQKRVMTPSAALASGASHLVVARPILQAKDPLAAAQAVLADMATVNPSQSERG